MGTQMMQYFCARRSCSRNINSAVSLNGEGVGSATVQPWQDPADVVEEFAQAAVNAGVEFPGDAMKQMMEYFCKRHSCKRLSLTPPTPPAQQQQQQPLQPAQQIVQ